MKQSGIVQCQQTLRTYYVVGAGIEMNRVERQPYECASKKIKYDTVQYGL